MSLRIMKPQAFSQSIEIMIIFILIHLLQLGKTSNNFSMYVYIDLKESMNFSVLFLESTYYQKDANYVPIYFF